jgi:hypothetical protein
MCWFGVALRRTQVLRLEARVLRDTSKHLRAYLFGIVERENIVGRAFPDKRFVGTRLTFDLPPDSDQSGENPPGLRRRPLAHAGMEILIG